MKVPAKIALVATTLVLGVSGALAQTSPPPRPEAASGPIQGPALEPVTYDYVQQAGSMTFEGSTLTLTGLAPSTIFFSDRPYRLVGHVDTARFVDLWSSGGSFAIDPPNAAISALAGGEQSPAIVEITGASLEGDSLTYTVSVLSGTLPAQADDVALFIDRGGWHGGGHAWHGPHGGGGVAWHGGGWHGGPYHPGNPYHHPYGPYHPYHPYGPYHPYHPYHPYGPYYPGWGPAAGFAAGALTGAAIGAAAASNSAPTYVYPVPAGQIPANCHLNAAHSRMICSVPIN